MDYSKNVPTALFMCLISGLSTALGGVFILLMKEPSFKVLGYMLGFSSGVMIYISFLDLLPEAIEEIGFLPANFYFFGGILFFALILQLVPDAEGEEHAHEPPKVASKPQKEVIKVGDQDKEEVDESDKQEDKHDDDKKSKKNKKKSEKSEKKEVHSDEDKKKKAKDAYLVKLGIVTAIGISLHNFPEGVAVYLACLKGANVGIPLMLAIAAHNIPEGMAVAAPIYTATGSKWQAFKYCLLSGLCEPAGAIIFGLIFKDYMSPYLVQCMLAAVAGIMIFMAIKELMPATLKYVSVNAATVSNVIGMFVIFLSIYWLHGMLPHDHGHGHGHGSPNDHLAFNEVHHSDGVQFDVSKIQQHHGHSHGAGDHGHSHGGSHGHSHHGHS
ncbi:hypothetical protein SAMD00019534_028640, partial [Acytostelium subglobosum LB1]|uniref:hypothetical protein n=1 Tax=Acytostelium subglobosum LB1 TaxID=1410327 RepID=UPI0006449407